MQIRCIRDFSQYEPGDLVEVPDGAAFDPFHFEAAVTVDLRTGDAETKITALQDQLTELDAKQAPAQFPPVAKEM